MTCDRQDPDRIESAMDMRIDLERFYTKQTDCPHPVMDAAQCVLCTAEAS